MNKDQHFRSFLRKMQISYGSISISKISQIPINIFTHDPYEFEYFISIKSMGNL